LFFILVTKNNTLFAVLGYMREAGKEHKAKGGGKKSLSKFLLNTSGITAESWVWFDMVQFGVVR
jgi:hypothetical protein